MNCKPGDLAIIIAADHPAEESDIGKIVDVWRLYPGLEEPFWLIHSSGSMVMAESFRGAGDYSPSAIVVCPDRCLRPIPPLGELDVIEISVPINDAIAIW